MSRVFLILSLDVARGNSRFKQGYLDGKLTTSRIQEPSETSKSGAEGVGESRNKNEVVQAKESEKKKTATESGNQKSPSIPTPPRAPR